MSFRESKRIVGIVDRIAGNRGTDRSGIYREAIRYWLADNSYLTDQEKQDVVGNGKSLGALLEEARNASSRRT